MTAATLFLVLLHLPPSISAEEKNETLIDIDLKDADATDILQLLAEVGQLNLVADPGVHCRLTLTLKAVSWGEVLKTVLGSCRLGAQRMGKNLIRVAPLRELARELEEERKYEEEKKNSGRLEISYRRLAYTRAKEIAPMLKKFLSPRGDVLFDERTNTLIIIDVVR